ncbi:TPA: restriction endonuclease subunit S [Bacillus cereus]|nr:hypothetical protein CN415_24565 [Bacillus cereus]
MSKKKKTTENLLEESLVAKEEQPYEVPGNWVWTTIQQVVPSMKARDPKKLQSETFRYIDVEAVDNKKQVVTNVKELSVAEAPSRARRQVNKGDVIISLVRPYLKNIAMISEQDESLVASTAFYVNSPTRFLTSKYLYNFLRADYSTQYLISNTKGDNSPSVRSTDYEKMPIPIPPVAEQDRIGEKVERLLGKIEEAKVLIEEVKETFEIRRAAVLDKAFRGGLNGNIYNQNSSKEYLFEIPDNWIWTRFDDVAKVCSNLVEPKLYEKLPHIAPDNIEKGTGSLLEYKTIGESKVKSSKHYFYAGQILYSKIRPYLSKVVIAEFDGLCSADMYPIETSLNTKYLFWYMLSPVFTEQASTAGSRSVLPKINKKELGRIFIPVPPEHIQEEIVSFIEKALQEESVTKSLLEDVLEKVKQTKQSVLSKAFRGELGTNNPTEKSALELLKEVLQEKIK